MINVVTDYNTIGYYVSSDSAEGFQLELMKALEKEWGIKVNLFLENSLMRIWRDYCHCGTTW